MKIQNKTTEEEFEFILENNTVIVFSLPTNTAFSHKIVLETSQPDADNEWLGITFRQSKTFIHFRENLPYFVDGTPLKMADETESKAFYKLRGQENNSLDFIYPPLAYTLSEGDMLLPKDI